MNALSPCRPTASRKLHKPGTIHPQNRVPMREISVHPMAGEPPFTVYDPSRPLYIRDGRNEHRKALPGFGTDGSRRAAMSKSRKAVTSDRRITGSRKPNGCHRNFPSDTGH